MTDLAAWVRERLDNCQRIAVTKEGSDRDGWLEDAAYFAAILDALTPRDAGAPESGLVRRKDVIDLLSRLANDHADMALYGEPDNARSREAMEAALTRVKYAVAFLEVVELTPRADREAIARVIYMQDAHYDSGENFDGFQVSPGGYLSWEQFKDQAAEFGDDRLFHGWEDRVREIYATTDAILALGVLHPSREAKEPDLVIRARETLADRYSPTDTVVMPIRQRALDVIWAYEAGTRHGPSSPSPSAIAEAERALERGIAAIEPFAEGASHLHPAHPNDGTTLDGIEVRTWREAYQAQCALCSALTALRASPAPSQPNG